MSDNTPSLLVNKLLAIFLIIIGFLAAASAYRYENTWGVIGGAVLLLAGIGLLAVKVIRRN